MATLDARIRMAHLLRRAGFGPAPGELDHRLADGYEATVRNLLEPGDHSDELNDLDKQIGGVLDFSNIDDVRTWWIYRMIHTRKPLVEKMAFFWHGHFATAVNKVGDAFKMYQQNQLFREYGLGNFENLLQRVGRDPAMLTYLDGAFNKKAHPNENFAREVMELFTIGIGQYKETDVLEAARAFTGWHLRDDQFYMNPGEHDDGPKSFMGQSGKLDGSDVLKFLAEHPATAERITRKLFEFFAYEGPDAKTLAPFVAVWKTSGGDVREVLRALFLSPVFFSDKAFRARIKSPAEFIIGSIRQLGGTIVPRQAVAVMARMGQDLFNPPSVKGWDGGLAWISTTSVFERMNFAASITNAHGPEGTNRIVPESVFNGIQPTSSRQMLQLGINSLLDGNLVDSAQQAILTYLEAVDPQGPKDGKNKPLTLASGDKRVLDEKTRGMIHLLLSTPEYQLN